MCNPANYCLNIVKLVRCTLICQTVCKHRAPGKLIANLWLRHGHPPRAAVSILTNHYPIHVFYSSVKLFSSSLNLKGTHFSRSIFFLGGGGGEGKEKSQRQTSRRRGLFPTKGHKHSSASVRKKKKKKKERKARWSQQFYLKLLRIHRFVIATIWLPPRCTGKSNAFVVKVGGFKIPSRL